MYGVKIKENREKLGLTQQELAEKIGFSQNAVHQWETEKREPSIEVLIKMADLFEVTLDELAGRDCPYVHRLK